MKIKVCGMREASNISSVAALDIDMIGFIFYPKSSRYVMEDKLEAEQHNLTIKSIETLKNNSKSIRRVGVFVDDNPQHILESVRSYSLNTIQLHGREDRNYIVALKDLLQTSTLFPITIIKAISVATQDDFSRCNEYEGIVDMLLFDTASASKGGSGKQFDWSLLQAYNGNTPFLLSGGIGPDDVSSIRQFHHSQFAGIDVNSRFESSPGIKDVTKLQTFIQQIKAI